jgi:hypothetical protein
VELAEAKKQIGDKQFLKGNLDSVALLNCKTKEEIAEMVNGRIRIGKPGRGIYFKYGVFSRAPGTTLETRTVHAARRGARRLLKIKDENLILHLFYFIL